MQITVWNATPPWLSVAALSNGSPGPLTPELRDSLTLPLPLAPLGADSGLPPLGVSSYLGQSLKTGEHTCVRTQACSPGLRALQRGWGTVLLKEAGAWVGGGWGWGVMSTSAQPPKTLSPYS